MKENPVAARDVARGMLAAALSVDKADPETWADALEHISEELRRRLAPLVGRDGLEALLQRCLILAKREVGWLEGIRVGPGGTLLGAREAISGITVGEVEDGCVSLLAHIVGLLNSLIGADLTRRLIGGAWLGASSENSRSCTEETRE